MTPSLCVSVASLRSTQEEYQRKALGAFQRLGLSHAALCFLIYTHISLRITVSQHSFTDKQNVRKLLWVYTLINPLYLPVSFAQFVICHMTCLLWHPFMNMFWKWVLYWKKASVTHILWYLIFYTHYSSWSLWYSLQPRLLTVRAMFYILIRWNGPNIHHLSHW